MFDCEQCGRSAGKQLGKCPRRGTPECSFVLLHGRVRTPRTKGLLLIISGILIIWFFLYFPILSFQDGSTEWFEVLLRTGLLAFFILCGAGLAIVGVGIFFSRRDVVYSIAEEKMWETYILNGYEYAYRSITDLKSVQSLCRQRGAFPIPAAVAAAESLTSLTSVINRYKVASARGPITDAGLVSELERLANYSVQSAFYHLCARGALQLKVGELYDSAGNDPGTLRTLPKVLIYRGMSGPAHGLLEQKILDAVVNWKESSWFSYSPLAPTIDLLIHEITETEPDQQGSAAIAILEIVAASFRQELKKGFPSSVIRPVQQDVREIILEASNNLPRLVESIQADIKNAIRSIRAPLVWGLVNPEMFTWHSVRVGTAVVVLMTGFLGFYSLKVRNVQKVTSYLEEYKEPAKEISQQALRSLAENENFEGIRQLARSANRAIDAIGSEMSGNSKYIRLRALDSLAATQTGKQLSGSYARHKSELMGALHDADPRIRAIGAEVVQRYGGSAGDMVPALLGRLSIDESALVRHSAAVTLGQLGIDDPAVRTGLIDAFNDTDPETRKAAMVAFSHVVKNPGDEAKIIQDLVDDPEVGGTAKKVLHSWGLPIRP